MLQQSTIQIAILPFKNLSPNRENDYICDGFAEEVINKLATIEGLSVTSRTSSFQFKNTKLGTPQIAEKLGVNVLIEGTLRFLNQQLKIAINLVSATKDEIVWNQTWEGDIEHIFSLESEISDQLAEKLRELFGHFDFEGIQTEQTDIDIETYKVYLKAHQLQSNWNEEDSFQAITLYNRVIENAPQFADAYIYKIGCYAFLRGQGIVTSDEITEEVSDTMQEAIKLNPNSPDLHFALAGFHFWNNWDLKSALDYLQKVLHANPSHGEAHSLLGLIYAISNKKPLAKKHFAYALKLDPLSANKHLTKAWGVYMLQDLEEAINLCKKALSLNKQLTVAVNVQVYALVLQNKSEEAFNLVQGFIETLDRYSVEGLKGLCHASVGNIHDTARCINHLLKLAEGEGRARAIEWLILIYGFTNDAENAIKWMKEAHKIRLPILLGITKDPLMQKVRTHPEFIKIEESITVLDWNDEFTPKRKAIPDQDWIDRNKEKLIIYMQEKQPFLEASITLRELASALEVQPNGLSWLINNEFGRNFSDYINMHRVEAFKKKIADAKNAHLSLLGIAYDCGFNSKTSFNTIFKKETGMTPKQYQKQLG